MTSRYEANVFAQPGLVRAALSRPAPSWMKPPKNRRVVFVGTGTNHHAAQLAARLWDRAGLDAYAVGSYDFVARSPRLSRGDLAIFLSHRGSQSYTTKAAASARRAGAEIVVVTGDESAWKPSRRVETGPMENTGAFTQSFTTTMAWLLRWPARPALLAPFKNMDKSLRWGPAFPRVRPETDLVLLGGGLREWVAREIALKVQETACLPARAFGLEEFLHGPRLSVGKKSLVVGFSAPKEKRWNAVRACLKASKTPFVEASSENWLAQVFWGQRLALDACRRLGVDPDRPRDDSPACRRALAEV